MNSIKIKCLKITIFSTVIFLVGCQSISFKQAIGFERSIPQEFTTTANIPFVIPPFIAELPLPEYEQLKTKNNKVLTAKSLLKDDSNIVPKNSDMSLLYFLDSSPVTKDAEIKFNSQIQGLHYLSGNEIAMLNNNMIVSSRGIIISIQE